jgi:hypothetical protein
MVHRSTSYLGLAVGLALLLDMGFTPTPVVAAKSPHPSIDGSWSFATLTPLERPPSVTKATFASPKERAEFVKQDLADREKRYVDELGGHSYSVEWYEWGVDTNGNRTSLITDPEDGRLPPQTPAARERMMASRKATRTPDGDNGQNAGPEDRSIQERCILGMNAGPPYISAFYNNNLEIVANDDYAMLITEMIHTARVVRLQPTPESPLRQYGGVSRGRWEGESLVIETKSFLAEGAQHVLKFTSAGGGSTSLQVTERFSLKDANTLRYEFTVNDPLTWTRPWTAAVLMARSKEPMYEYACHEGNYAMKNILTGARISEQKALGKLDGGPK